MSKDKTQHMFGGASNGLPRMSDGTGLRPSRIPGSGDDRDDRDDPGGRTQLYTPAPRDSKEQEKARLDGLKFDETRPVVGWLVITQGPGRGASHTLHYGNNRIGRDTSQSVRMDYGDREMSGSHAVINFEQRSGSFTIRPSPEVSNNIYLEGVALQESLPLESGAMIELTSKTHARFVALCGEGFSWEDNG